jgi:hypothetical protein
MGKHTTNGQSIIRILLSSVLEGYPELWAVIRDRFHGLVVAVVVWPKRGLGAISQQGH